MEVYKMLPEGTLAELIDGSIYMSPAPNVQHQQIVGRLYRRLADHVEKKDLGLVFVSPLDVFLDEHDNVVQPDLIFISKDRQSILMRDAIHGSPDLLLEVLSPGNHTKDRSQKKKLYERFGVKEYWIIDPVSFQSYGYQLDNGIYREFYSAKGKINSHILRCVLNFEN